MLPSQLINQTLQAARLQYESGQCVFADAHARAYGKFLVLARFLPHEARTFPADLLPCCFSRITTLHGHGKRALCSTWLLAPCKLRSLKTASYTGISSPRCTSLVFLHTVPAASCGPKTFLESSRSIVDYQTMLSRTRTLASCRLTLKHAITDIVVISISPLFTDPFHAQTRLRPMLVWVVLKIKAPLGALLVRVRACLG